jgi:hypothetical protein
MTIILVIVILPFFVLYKTIRVILTWLAKGFKLVVSLVRRIRLRVLSLAGYQEIPDEKDSDLSVHFKKTLCRDEVRVHFVGAW